MEKIESSYYNIYEEYGLKHYQLPKVFFTNEKYAKMTNDTKVAWAILRDRFTLSVKNGWYDKNGNIYFIFTNEELKEILNVGNTKLSNIKKELEKNDLLEQKRLGQGKANRLYIKKPIVTESDIYKIKNDEENLKKPNQDLTENNGEIPWGSNEVPKRDFKKSQNESFKDPETGQLEIPKTDTNDTEFSKTDSSETDNNLNLNHMDEYIWTMKLPMPLKKYFSEKVKVLVAHDTTFDISEVEYFYNTYTNYIDPHCTRDDTGYLNDIEFTKIIKKMYETVDRPITNMEGLIKTWVQNGIYYKAENYSMDNPAENNIED